MSLAVATRGTAIMTPSSAGGRAEVWVRTSDSDDWHLAVGKARLAFCGRLVENRGRWVWPLHDEEPGPPPTDQCVECADDYTRETGRLTLA